VGAELGLAVGAALGARVGLADGTSVGDWVGAADGDVLTVGRAVGLA
jgi:hypothetical protein